MDRTCSLWWRDIDLPEREPLNGDATADVAVLGAGMAGLLIAHRLAQQGLSVVVLEASRVGSGQTGKTTAKITSQHGPRYDAMIKKLGVEKAEQYARANQKAIAEYAALIQREQIDCDFEWTSAFLYSSVAGEPMQAEAEAAKRLGIDVTFTTETELPVPVAGAVRFDAQAQFHPLKFLCALSRKLTIFENTRVLQVAGNEVQTERGSVQAQHIVFATHYPFINAPGWYFLRMHQERSYVLALAGTQGVNGMYLGVDPDGLSFRATEGLLLLGGGSHRTGECSAGGQYEQLHQCAASLYPDCREVARWSAQDCMPLDGVPYIGRFSAATPNWYVATGFGKWGMSSAMVAAMLIADSITGCVPDWAEVFSPSRFQVSASAKNLATEAAQAVKGLSRSLLALPQETLDALPAGHGGIVTVDGRKLGAFKDERGKVTLVEPRCPHLGCQVEWNPNERSWDCPCHGSRFAYDGMLIDNPAQQSLRRVEEQRPITQRE